MRTESPLRLVTKNSGPYFDSIAARNDAGTFNRPFSSILASALPRSIGRTLQGGSVRGTTFCASTCPACRTSPLLTRAARGCEVECGISNTTHFAPLQTTTGIVESRSAECQEGYEELSSKGRANTRR